VRPDDIVGSVQYGGYNVPSNPLPGQVDTTDISESLAPFIVVFDRSGNVLSSSAMLGTEEVPTPPVGVFSYTSKNNEDRFTWQPIPQVRIAAVLVKVSVSPAATSSAIAPGFVLAGRSLREVEVRESQLLNQVALAWIILLIVSLGYSIFISGKNGQVAK
jgi:hypothetical protein